MLIEGSVLKVGDDLDTDLMYPGRYLSLVSREEQARHALEGLGPEWPARVREARVLVGGRNLGIGSSREQAATALLGAGIGLVLAASCSRTFFRNCINNGLPVIQAPELVGKLADGASVRADVANGWIESGSGREHFEPLPAPLLRIVAAGGLLESLATERPVS